MDYIELKLSPAQQERFRKAVDDAGPIEQWIKDAVTQFKDLQNRAHSIAEFVKYKTVSIPGEILRPINDLEPLNENLKEFNNDHEQYTREAISIIFQLSASGKFEATDLLIRLEVVAVDIINKYAVIKKEMEDMELALQNAEVSLQTSLN